MKSLFTSETLSEIEKRIKKLKIDTKPTWGKMDVGQMLKHCQVPFKIIDGTVVPDSKMGMVKKFIFSLMKPVMYNDKPWKKNIPTGKEFIFNEAGINSKEEKEKLLQLVQDFHIRNDQTEWPPHPIFGSFTPEQWGKMQYKHLDHHLTQFGV